MQLMNTATVTHTPLLQYCRYAEPPTLDVRLPRITRAMVCFLFGPNIIPHNTHALQPLWIDSRPFSQSRLQVEVGSLHLSSGALAYGRQTGERKNGVR
jgi:hypothetical protein